MKQLTCEMCGGTDLVKQDGVFVCQSCGIEEKYKNLTPLINGIQTAIRIVPADQTTCRRGQEYCILKLAARRVVLPAAVNI